MTLGASVGHRFGHTIIFRPDDILPQIPPIGPERKCDHPGNPDQVFGLQIRTTDAHRSPIRPPDTTIKRAFRLTHYLSCVAIIGNEIMFPVWPASAFCYVPGIGVSEIKPKRAFLLQHPPDFPEDIHQLAYVGFRALLQANLPIYSIVS